MTALITQTALIITLSLLAGILIGIMITLNYVRKTNDVTSNNQTLDAYNNFLSKQPKK